jgi:uncharacterized protein YpuA (DUF1002 family)
MTITITTRYSYGQLVAEVHSETVEELVSAYDFGDSDYDKADSDAVYAYTSQLPVVLTDDAVEELVNEYRQTDNYNDTYNKVLNDIAKESVNVFKVFENEEEAKGFLSPYIKSIIRKDGRQAIDGGNRDWVQKNNAIANRYTNGDVAIALINYIY